MSVIFIELSSHLLKIRTAFFNKPALGVTVHQRQADTIEGLPFVELNVWKVRETQLYGFEKGSRYCTFDKEMMTYEKREYQGGHP